jgi:hypothetical protein
MNYKLKNIAAAITVILIVYALLAFIAGSLSALEWHWVAKAIFGLAIYRTIILLLSKIS